MGSPPDGCQSLRNGDDIHGSVVVLKRGSCMFALKVLTSVDRQCCSAAAEASLLHDAIVITHCILEWQKTLVTSGTLYLSSSTLHGDGAWNCISHDKACNHIFKVWLENCGREVRCILGVR